MRRERGFAGGGWTCEQGASAVRMRRRPAVWGRTWRTWRSWRTWRTSQGLGEGNSSRPPAALNDPHFHVCPYPLPRTTVTPALALDPGRGESAAGAAVADTYQAEFVEEALVSLWHACCIQCGS